MKVRFVFDKKAQDANIELHDVPFDTNRFDDVVKALRTLGPDEKVMEMVKLTSRTNKSMLFTFIGDENTLQNFFKRFYVHMTWDEIRAAHGNKPKKDKEKEEPKKEAAPVVIDLTKYLADKGVKNPVVTFDEKNLLLTLEPISLELNRILAVDLAKENSRSEIFQLLKKYRYTVNKLDQNKIYLK